MSFLRDLLSLPTPASPQISPDGQKVVYSTSLPYDHKTADHFRSTLWLAETGKRESARPLTSGEFNDREPRWNGGKGGRKIVYLSADEKTEEAKAREREKDDARVWGEDWAYNRLRMVDLDSKESATLISKEVHIIDLACSEDGSKIAVSYVKNPDLDAKYLYGTTVAVYELATKALTEICHFATYLTELTWVGDNLYFIGPADETTAASSQMVFRIDLGTGIKHKGYTKQAYGEVNCAMKLKRLGTALAIGIQDGMADEIHILEGRRRESRNLFTQNQTLDAWDAIVRPDSDEVILALSTSSTSHPAEVYSMTVSSLSSDGGGVDPITPLSTHGQNLLTTYPNELTRIHSKFLTCPSADGTVQLDATLFLPTSQSTPRRPPHPFPTLVTLHGGPYYRFTTTFAPLLPHSIFTALLLSAGYAILLPNYRGSSGRGRAFAEYGKNGGSGREGYEDVITMTSHAVREGFVDPARVGVGGWSQGGFLSYLCGVRDWGRGDGDGDGDGSSEDSDDGKGSEGVGGGAGGRVTKEGERGRGWRFRFAIPGAGGQLAGSGRPPWRLGKGDVRNRETSAIWEVREAVEKGVKIPPMLILHGEKDERVPLEQGMGMRRALEGIGVPCEFVVYPREGHFIQERKHLMDIAERSLRFVEKYIGGNRAEESM
ncbi:hypothetical protein KC315_g13569 [Hortaea werneckii]|nr:hypothetical protein KC315_g13569 [Hortaea werneckii]KAI7370117.1 hypothetical protein KC354_g1475 [Hortaea werneckii]